MVAHLGDLLTWLARRPEDSRVLVSLVAALGEGGCAMSMATFTRSIKSIGTPFFLRKRFCRGNSRYFWDTAEVLKPQMAIWRNLPTMGSTEMTI